MRQCGVKCVYAERAYWHILLPNGEAKLACDACMGWSLRTRSEFAKMIQFHELLSECNMPGTGWDATMNVCMVWDGTQKEAWSGRPEVPTQGRA